MREQELRRSRRLNQKGHGGSVLMRRAKQMMPCLERRGVYKGHIWKVMSFGCFEQMPSPNRGTSTSDGAAKSILKGSITALAVKTFYWRFHRIQNQAMQMMSGKIKPAEIGDYVEYRNCKSSRACSKVEHGGNVKIMTRATIFKAPERPQESLRVSLPARARQTKRPSPIYQTRTQKLSDPAIRSQRLSRIWND